MRRVIIVRESTGKDCATFANSGSGYMRISPLHNRHTSLGWSNDLNPRPKHPGEERRLARSLGCGHGDAGGDARRRRYEPRWCEVSMTRVSFVRHLRASSEYMRLPPLKNQHTLIGRSDVLRPRTCTRYDTIVISLRRRRNWAYHSASRHDDCPCFFWFGVQSCFGLKSRCP